MNDAAARQYADRARRMAHTIQSQPSWVTKTAAIAGTLVLLAISLVIIIPVALVVLLVFIAAMIIAKIRSWFASLSAPNGPRDGRNNVRVITRP